MTLNSLTASCNQKSSRRPVMTMDESAVITALDGLRKKGLVTTVTGGTSRTIKYKHNFSLVFPVGPESFAIICLLLLRADQTPGELNANSGRLYEFESLEEVLTALDQLSSGDHPMVVQMPRRTGQKEMRYMHLFGGTPEIIEDLPTQSTDKDASGSIQVLEERVAQLETELGELKAAFDGLMKELNG